MTPSPSSTSSATGIETNPYESGLAYRRRSGLRGQKLFRHLHQNKQVDMRIVAILAVSDERFYLANCLSHLIKNGLDFAIIDNGASDECAQIIHSSRFAPSLAGYSQVPFTGVFSWEEILLAQERLL